MTDPGTPSWPSTPPAEPANSPPPMWPEGKPPAKSSSGSGMKIAVAVLGVTTLLFAGLWLQERGRADDLQADQDRVVAAAEALPDLQAIAEGLDDDATGVDFDGDAERLDVSIPSPGPDEMRWLGALLDELGFPPATVDRMEQTRALDGTLDAEGDHTTATWTYHPDDGFSVVFSVDD